MQTFLCKTIVDFFMIYKRYATPRSSWVVFNCNVSLMKIAAYMAGRNVIRGDCGLGHLTFKGYKQEEMNGENLRKAYVDTGFLSSNYSVHEDFFRTDGE